MRNRRVAGRPKGSRALQRLQAAWIDAAIRRWTSQRGDRSLPNCRAVRLSEMRRDGRTDGCEMRSIKAVHPRNRFDRSDPKHPLIWSRCVEQESCFRERRIAICRYSTNELIHDEERTTEQLGAIF